MTFKKGKRSGEWTKKPGIMPLGILKCFSDYLENHNGQSFHRESLAEMIIWTDPYWSRFFFIKEVPFGVMADPAILDSIIESMPIKKKRSILNNALVDVSHLRACELNKITNIKNRLAKNGMRFTSNKDGIGNLDTASLETVSKSLYRMLNWNKGQLKTWHEHADKFSDECKNKKLVSNLNKHSKDAYHWIRLPKLTNDIGIEAGILPKKL